MTSLLVNPPSVRRYSIGLDAIRGALALWVVFAHLIPWTQITQGAEAMPGPLVIGRAFATRLFQPNAEVGPGVLAFIVLSGYCIHRAGFRASGGVTRFALRRIFRILPVFIVATIAGIVSFLIALRLDPANGTLLSGTTAIDPVCVAAKLTGVAALAPVFHPCSYVGNAPLTTIMAEIWLYVAYAVLFWVFIRRGHERAVWWICGALFVAGLVVAAGASRAPVFYNWWQNSSVAGFLAFWWIGALFVSPAVASRSRPLALTALAVWLALTALPVHPVTGELKKLMFCVVAGAAIVALDTATFPGLRPVGLLGKVSYSLFAFHAPVTYILLIMGIPWWQVLIVNVIIAIAGYYVIERPFIAHGRRIAQAIDAPGSSFVPPVVAPIPVPAPET